MKALAARGERGRVEMRRMEDEARGLPERVPGQNYIQSREPSLLERGLSYLPEPVEQAVMSGVRRFERSPMGGVARYVSSPEFLADVETGGAAKAASGLLRLSRERMDREALERAIEAGEVSFRRRRNPADAPVRTVLKEEQGGAAPLILRDPRQIALEVADKVAPESPALRDLFGVTRADLVQMARDRPATEFRPSVFADKPQGSRAAEAVMTDRNRQRVLDVLEEVDAVAPELTEGMYGWYMMDPLYDRAVQLHGPELGVKYVDDFLATGGAMSPQSTVNAELRKAAAERFFTRQGLGEEFLEYGAAAKGERVLPEFEIPYPSSIGFRSQIKNARAFRDTGVLPETPKTEMYIRASGLPGRSAFDFQNNIPVPDAHFTRALGLPMTRTGGDLYKSMSDAELQTIMPFYSRLARDLGINPVSAQAIQWGAFGPSTGVETLLGAPKLEILADQITRVARRTGLPPDLVRDAVISGDIPLDNPGKEALRRIFGAR